MLIYSGPVAWIQSHIVVHHSGCVVQYKAISLQEDWFCAASVASGSLMSKDRSVVIVRGRGVESSPPESRFPSESESPTPGMYHSLIVHWASYYTVSASVQLLPVMLPKTCPFIIPFCFLIHYCAPFIRRIPNFCQVILKYTISISHVKTQSWSLDFGAGVESKILITPESPRKNKDIPAQGVFPELWCVLKECLVYIRLPYMWATYPNSDFMVECS